MSDLRAICRPWRGLFRNMPSYRRQTALTREDVGRCIPRLIVGVLVGACPAAVYAQDPAIGKLTYSGQVMTTGQPVTAGTPPVYRPARQDAAVVVGEGVRTLRRSRAQIKFKDQSILRMNERSDLVVQDTSTLRRIQLNTGLVWVRVAKGIATQVETPSATAVARGTQFTVTSNNGLTQVAVYEGQVAVQKDGKEVIVGPNQQVTVTAEGGLPDSPQIIPPTERPPESGGTNDTWFNEMVQDLGVATLNGSSRFADLRTSIAGETGQQLTSAGLAGNEENVLPFFLTDPAQRALFLGIVQRTLVPDFRVQNNSGISLNGYRDQFGTQLVGDRFTLTAQDASFLANLGVKNVREFVDASVANGGTARFTIEGRSRTFYRPGSITGPPNFDLTLFDRNETNDSLLAYGSAMALLINSLSENGWAASVPKFEISGFGQGSDPTSLVGGRARVSASVGRTRFRFESNAVELVNSNRNRTSFSRLASVAEVEQIITPELTVFAGRRRFYHGPVFQNQNLSQLIADRYSGAGLTLRSGAVAFEGAYLHDSNPDVDGAQRGALGSVFYKGLGGRFGLHYLHVSKLQGGNGFTGSLSYPLVPHTVDIYAEAGQGPDKATLQTYGVYLPGLYQQTQIDSFVEYSSRQGLGRSVSFIASRNLGPYLNFRGFLTLADYERGGNETLIGVTTLIRFGN